MSLLFEKECSYEVAEDISFVRTHIQTISKKHIQDLAPNFLGKVEGDKFEFKPRLFWQTDFFGFPYNSHSLTGTLIPEGQQTKIKIIVKPSKGEIAIYYLILITSIITILKLDIPLKKEGWASLLGILIIFLFVLFNIIVARRLLIKRFEKLIHLQ